MFPTQKQLLLVLISSLLFCSTVFSQDDHPLLIETNDKTYKCDEKNRPKPDDCYKEPYQSTCGYYKKDCPLEICGASAFNDCEACSNPDVLYYRRGDCKPQEVVQKCTEDICTGLPEEETKIYEPVCGLRQNRKKVTTRTFDNYCKACQNKRFPYYQNGPCEDDRHICEKPRPEICTTEFNPVCAHFSTNDVFSAFTTASNGCEACRDPSVDYYTDGPCGPSRDEATYCLPNNRPDICTLEYNPVCGFFRQEDGSLGHRIEGNPCGACAQSDIIYYLPGPCVFECNRDPNIIFDCAGIYEPVCGEYTQNGRTIKVSLRNSCIGCYYSGRPIETYTDGLCPGDRGIRCENDAGAFLEGFLHPVCGYEREFCRQDFCRDTYAEPILACSNPDVIWYSSGTCPGDDGVPCDSYRNRPTDGSGFIYSDVCGYTRRGSRTYADQYEACENFLVLYFTEGPC